MSASESPTINSPRTGERTSVSDDGVRVHPHVYGLPVKRSSPPDFRKQLLRRIKAEGDDKKAKSLVEDYAAQLITTRTQLYEKLGESTVSDIEEAVTQAFQDYAGLLSGLAIANGSSLEIGKVGEAPAALQPSQMRDAVNFKWHDVLLANQEVASDDALFELASCIIALAGWRMRRASYLCKDSRAGVKSPDATKAYWLVLQAAGGFAYVKDNCSPLLASVCASADCTEKAASAFMHITLADAQAITTLRAMAKNNAPGLVASLALDTALLYKSAEFAAKSAPFSSAAPKGLKYAEYKRTVFQAYGCCFAGLAKLKETKAGEAVRLLEEAKKLASQAIPLAAAYNKAEPSTPAADHTEFDRDLSICVDNALARARKDNDHVYYQRPPVNLPDLPEPRRLANATPFILPPPTSIAAEVTFLKAFDAAPGPEPAISPAPQTASNPALAAGGAPLVSQTAKPGLTDKPADDNPESASCWRWLLVIIAMPILVILSVVGIIIWLILLPIKIICCPIGCLIQIMADVVEYLLKAPFRGLLWASGKPWKAKKKVDVEAQA